ncbi:MAG: motility protein A [Planctomycetota bacterium]|nr:MAG: motility protein A [Planctomycetota bacterium]
MDIATVLGIVLGIGLVLGAILMKGALSAFIDPASLAIVAGGTVAAVLISFPLNQVLRVFGVVKQAFFARPVNPVDYVLALTKLAEVARRDGILSLESHLADGDYDPFLTQGLRMAIDGQDPAVIEAALEQEVETVMERHANGKALFDNMGKYAPAFGMIGTLIGLVIMLGNLSDLESLGPAMAVALITTFYGSVIANMFAMPIADKLAVRSAAEIAAKLLVIRGVMSIQAGDNPRIVQQKLLAFLDAKQRTQIEAAAA